MKTRLTFFPFRSHPTQMTFSCSIRFLIYLNSSGQVHLNINLTIRCLMLALLPPAILISHSHLQIQSKYPRIPMACRHQSVSRFNNLKLSLHLRVLRYKFRNSNPSSMSR